VSDTQGQDAARQDEPGEPVRLRMRRAPKYRAFGLTGVIVGVVIGLVLAFSREAGADYSQQTIAGYFAASFGLVGALIGLGLAVVADRRR
jgi:di/tricarboxylate transporter